MNKKYITWNDFEYQLKYIGNSIIVNKDIPNHIIALTRGGACLGTGLSYRFNDTPITYFNPKLHKFTDKQFDHINWSKNKILVVDDINDTGNTLIQTKKDIIKTIHPEVTDSLTEVFELNSVKFAVLINNIVSPFKVDYSVLKIDKSIDNSWIVFPWEND